MANFSAEVLEELNAVQTQLENLMDQYPETSSEHLGILAVWAEVYELLQNNGDNA